MGGGKKKEKIGGPKAGFPPFGRMELKGEVWKDIDRKNVYIANMGWELKKTESHVRKGQLSNRNSFV